MVVPFDCLHTLAHFELCHPENRHRHRNSRQIQRQNRYIYSEQYQCGSLSLDSFCLRFVFQRRNLDINPSLLLFAIYRSSLRRVSDHSMNLGLGHCYRMNRMKRPEEQQSRRMDRPSSLVAKNKRNGLDLCRNRWSRTMVQVPVVHCWHNCILRDGTKLW